MTARRPASIMERLDRDAKVGSFKLRLVLYFVALSLVPLAGATWAFSAASADREVERADASLSKSARAAVGDVAALLDEARERAAELARSTEVQRAIADGDEAALEAVAARVSGSAFTVGGAGVGGVGPEPALEGSAEIVDGARTLGTVTVAVPLDGELVVRLTQGVGLDPEELLAVAVGGEIAAGPQALLGEPAAVSSSEAVELELAGTTYRAVAAPLPGGEASAALLALTPRSAIDTAISGVNFRLLWAALASLAIVAAVAFLPGQAIVGSLRELSRAAAGIAQGRLSERVPVRGRDEFARLGAAFNDMAEQLERRHDELAAERARVRSALARVGAALAAGNEAEALLPVVAESAVEATGAAGARVLDGGREVARVGRPQEGGDSLELGLGAGERGEPLRLVLSPGAGTAFGEDALDAAGSLAAQAVVALENARLHELVRRQAVTDELTGLANRRRFDEALELEVSRVRRFGGPLSLVVADLDGFKQINDRHGHPFGDAVLRLFADVIRGTVRAIDLPARPGGEEFAVILPGTDLAGAGVVAERLRARLEAWRAVAPGGGLVPVTASFGIAAYAPPSCAADLVAAADDALYRAKAEGKNRVAAAPEPASPARVPSLGRTS